MAEAFAVVREAAIPVRRMCYFDSQVDGRYRFPIAARSPKSKTVKARRWWRCCPVYLNALVGEGATCGDGE